MVQCEGRAEAAVSTPWKTPVARPSRQLRAVVFANAKDAWRPLSALHGRRQSPGQSRHLRAVVFASSFRLQVTLADLDGLQAAQQPDVPPLAPRVVADEPATGAVEFRSRLQAHEPGDLALLEAAVAGSQHLRRGLGALVF